MDKHEQEFFEAHKIRLEKAKEKAKQKANELVLKFAFKGAQHEGEAKQFALIAVDEIIKALRKDLPEVGLGKGYWFNVREEIKKI